MFQTDATTNLLVKHLKLLLSLANEIITLATNKMLAHKANCDVTRRIAVIVYNSPAGFMLEHAMHALLLLPDDCVRQLLHSMLALAPQLDSLARALPLIARLERDEFELDSKSILTAELIKKADPCDWSFVLSTERTCALVIGRCLSNMMVGEPTTADEQLSSSWLQLHLFSNGCSSCALDSDNAVKDLCESAKTSPAERTMPQVLEGKMAPKTTQLVQLALSLVPDRRDLWLQLRDYAQERGHSSFMTLNLAACWKYTCLYGLASDWDTSESENPLLDAASRFLLAAYLKHCGLVDVFAQNK